MLNNLIGYRLISMNDKGFFVKKDNDIKHFIFEEDYGDCCGYNDISANLIFSERLILNNPVITNVQIEHNEDTHSDMMTITFFGESKPIAEINSLSSSGSGYVYGACAWIKCAETNETFDMTSW